MKKRQHNESSNEKMKTNEANKKVNDVFYNDKNSPDTKLYNLGDSTPLLVEEDE